MNNLIRVVQSALFVAALVAVCALPIYTAEFSAVGSPGGLDELESFGSADDTAPWYMNTMLGAAWGGIASIAMGTPFGVFSAALAIVSLTAMIVGGVSAFLGSPEARRRFSRGPAWIALTPILLQLFFTWAMFDAADLRTIELSFRVGAGAWCSVILLPLASQMYRLDRRTAPARAAREYSVDE